MDLKQIIKEEIEDFNWMKSVSDDLIPGQKYMIKSGNNWSEYEFVEFDPDYDYEFDHGEYRSMEVYKFKHNSGTAMMSKSHIEDLKSKGFVRIQDGEFSFESMFRWGNINDIDNGDSFAIYFRDGVKIDDTFPIQEILLKKGFRFYSKEGGREYLTSSDLGENQTILLFESINWDTKHKSMGVYPYSNMDPKQRDKKLLLIAKYPDGVSWTNNYFSEELLRNEIERSTNEWPHHNAIVIDGHKLLNELNG